MKRMILWLLVIGISFLAASCTPGGEELIPTDPTASESILPTLPPPDENQPSDTIRLAIRKEADLNPLLPKHYATQALFRLVYEPLFDFTYDGRLVPVTAQSWQWSLDGLELEITIRQDKVFHNGRSLDSRDVQVSLETWLAASLDPAQSQRAGKGLFDPQPFSGKERAQRLALQNILGISSDGQDKVLIRLKTPDPSLPRYLTAFVAPASEAGSRSMNPLSGSGPWQIQSYNSSQGLVLTRRQVDEGIQTILARPFESIHQAARAFGDNEIDLLLMDASETALYADRSRIRKQRFEDGGFISIYFNPRKGKAMEKRDALLYIFTSDPEIASLAAPFDYGQYPCLRGDFRFQGMAIPALSVDRLPEGYRAEEEADLFDEAGQPLVPDRPLFRLLVPQGFMPARLLDRLATAFLKINRKLVIEYAAEDSWTAALRTDRYDAALLVDSSWLYADPADYLDGLSALGLYDWKGQEADEGRQTLLRARLQSLEGLEEEPLSPSQYTRAVFEVYQDIPAAGLATSSTLLWYSSEVEGFLAGSWRHPYQGLEDLIIWRP